MYGEALKALAILRHASDPIRTLVVISDGIDPNEKQTGNVAADLIKQAQADEKAEAS